ncbi:MAG: hypothetical protein M3Z27_00335 [Actinomycetota bacterium]|nr:hypothetical protein [Actinomycetota bacterium]
MDPRALARTVALGRILIGAGLLAKPELFTLSWIGSDAKRAGPKVLSRALGARDLVLGAGTISSEDRELQGWLLAATAADATDLLATVLAGEGVPLRGRVMVGGTALGGAALGLAALVGLNR